MSIISVELAGGLGNMLFQISAAYAVSLRDNKEFICDTKHIHSSHGEYTNYLTNIFRKIKIKNNLPFVGGYGEINFSYNEIPKFNENILLLGYYQTEKYFKNYSNEILNLFKIDEDTETYLLTKYNDLLKMNTCSLHIRRGDYLGQPEFHPVLELDYYKESISHFDEDTQFLIFSNDIEWCENNLDFIKNKTFISGNHNYQDLYLMSLCKHNIIANSSFSWWGAWLNQNENKKVISPKIWFGPRYHSYNTIDLYCEGWIKI